MAPGGAPGPSLGPSAPNPDAFMLPGFARREQQELDVRSASFRAVWLQETYTEPKKLDRIAAGAPRDVHETTVHEVCYGNNVTLLFRLCFHLSEFYGSDTLWEALAHAFSTQPAAVEDMVDVLSRARRAYVLHHGSSFRSGATKAVDYWITFVEGRGASQRPSRAGHQVALHRADRYLADAASKFLQVDSADMLDRPAPRPPGSSSSSSHSSSSRPPRKRSRSPPDSRNGDAPAAKRMSAHLPTRSPGRSHQQEPPPASRNPMSAPPFTSRADAARPTGQIPGRAQSRSRAQDGHASSSGSGNPPAAENVSYRIRGCAGQDKDLAPPTGPSLQQQQQQQQQEEEEEEEEEKKEGDGGVVAMLRRQIEQLERERNAAHERAAASTEILQKLTLFEKRLAVTEARQTRDAEDAQAVAASLETRLSAAAAVDAGAARGLQARLDSLEASLALLKTAPPAEGEEQARRLEARVAALEGRLGPPGPAGEGKKNAAAGEGPMEGVMKRLSSLEGALYASTAERVTSMRDIMDRLAALETQGPRPAKTTTFEAPQTPKSPSPSHDATMQRNMENMLNKRIQGLPTMASVSEKTFQVESNLRDMINRYKDETNHRLDTAMKEIDDAKARVKGLTAHLNGNTLDLDGQRSSVKALEGAVMKLSRRLGPTGGGGGGGGEAPARPDGAELETLRRALREVETKAQATATETALLGDRVAKIATGFAELIRDIQMDLV